jgi:DNA-binding IclR family transcriptional regulator
MTNQSSTTELTSARDERTAVDKALSLMMAFGADTRGALGVSELARRTGLSKSTAFRLLSMLERNKVVQRVGTSYQLGTLLQDLTSHTSVPMHDSLRDALTPYLAELYEITHHTVQLAVLHGTEVIYLNKLYGHRPVNSPARIGGRAPAYATAVGKVLLAWNQESTEQTLASTLVPWTERTITQPKALLASLEEIRRDGVAYDRDESLVGLSCIAVPIMGRTGRPVAAFSVSGQTGTFIAASHSHALRSVAFAASRALRAARPPVQLRARIGA